MEGSRRSVVQRSDLLSSPHQGEKGGEEEGEWRRSGIQRSDTPCPPHQMLHHHSLLPPFHFHQMHHRALLPPFHFVTEQQEDWTLFWEDIERLLGADVGRLLNASASG